MPAKQPMLKGCSLQLAQGTGPQSGFKRSNSEQSGRLLIQLERGSSSHGSLEQGPHVPASAAAVADSAGLVCAGAVCPHAARNGMTAATARKNTSLQVSDKGKPQTCTRWKNRKRSSADYAYAGQACQCDMAA